MHKQNLSGFDEVRTPTQQPSKVHHVIGRQNPLHVAADNFAQCHTPRGPVMESFQTCVDLYLDLQRS